MRPAELSAIDTAATRPRERICGAGRDLRSRHAIQISILQFHSFAFPLALLFAFFSCAAFNVGSGQSIDPPPVSPVARLHEPLCCSADRRNDIIDG